MSILKFENATETKTGIEVKNVRFNSAANAYLGMVKDPLWQANPVVIKNGGFATGTWNKRGQCINRTRPELDLKQP